MRAILRLGFLFACGLAATASAQEPVTFDSQRLFPCTEVKPPQQADTSRKVVVFVIPISANFHVEESTVKTLRNEFRFPKSVRILDYFPKKQTGTDVAGLTEEQRREHQITDLNVEYGGKGEINFSRWGVGVKAGGGAEEKKRDFKEVETNIRSSHLPPRGQVVAVGSEDQGKTLFFELTWFNQVSRHGLTDYAFLAEVSKNWPGDVITIECSARNGDAVVGHLEETVGLYPNADGAARESIEKRLDTAQPAKREAKDLVQTSIGSKLKLIHGGSFQMGATPEDTTAQDDEKPQHKVTITKPYYIGVNEVTQFEYKQVMNDNPSKFKDSDRLPVEQVSWLDAVKFCNKLSELDRRKPYYKIDGDSVTILGGNGFRLPTEAEWEYACRAPQNPEMATKHPFGENDADLPSFAWFDKKHDSKTHIVGQKKPNRWGLHDMQGNVWEWCQDWYSADYYTFAPENDPAGPAKASFRVFRGGGWGNAAGNCRPAIRNWGGPGDRDFSLGFRLAADQ